MHHTLTEAPPPFRGTEMCTLANRCTILLKEDSTVPVVSLQVWARCGAIDERPPLWGISHGLEHMVFKGTPTRTAGEITKAIESQGGYINAATQLETTHFYMDVPAYAAASSLDVLMDTILHPTFPLKELEREKLVILEEIHRRNDDPESTLWDEFISHVFRGTPYSTRIIGTEQTVSNLKQMDLVNYFKAHYTGPNVKVVVVGDFDKPKTLKKIESGFGKLPSVPPPAVPVIGDPTPNGFHHEIKRPIQLSYLAVGCVTGGLCDPDIVALDILAEVLGGGQSSRLVQKLQEENQTALSISCDYIPFQQKGLFAFFLQTFPDQALSAVAQLKEEIKKLTDRPLTNQELNRAKARVKSNWLLGVETQRGKASSLGSLSSLGRLNLLTTYLEQVNKLSIDDLRNVYERHVRGNKMTVTHLTP